MTGPARPPTLRSALRGLPLAGWLAIVAAALAAVVVAVPAADLVSALARPAPRVSGPGESAGGPPSRLEAYAAQIDGRSLFFVPAPPDPPPPPAPVTPQADPGPPPPPSRYGGPSLVALVNGSAIFADGTMAELGGPAVNGVQVVGYDAPWSATVRWSGVEFTVTLFEKDRLIYPDPPSGSSPGAASAGDSP